MVLGGCPLCLRVLGSPPRTLSLWLLLTPTPLRRRARVTELLANCIESVSQLTQGFTMQPTKARCEVTHSMHVRITSCGVSRRLLLVACLGA